MMKLDVPEELKLEFYERRVNEAVFDRLDLVVGLMPGKDDCGAIVKCFLDAIAVHDEIVKRIEEKMDVIGDLKRSYQKKSRLFRNLDSAWNIMLDNPVDFYEYVELIPKMKNIEARLKVIEDAKIKAELLTEYYRYQSLHPICSKQLIIYNTYTAARNERDEALKALSAGETALTAIKKEEREAAMKISDDHILADETNRHLSALFPNVQVGYVLSRINNESVEHLSYEDVLIKISRSKSPQTCEFLRYDYRFNPFSNVWSSLAELRELGVCVEDPMLARINFITLAGQGDLAAVNQLLEQGVDPNCCDYSGSTALILAASYRRAEVCELLVKSGANVNCRDKNLMTPLLFAVSCGYMDIVRLLLTLGADKECSDKNYRDVIYYAVLSGKEPILKLFLRPERCNHADKLWGFTPLHLAANTGNLEMVKFLLTYGSSMYIPDLKGLSAEEVARDGGQTAVAEYLRNERFCAPGQLAHHQEDKGVKVWIGDLGAMDMHWMADLGFDAIVYFHTTAVLPKKVQWLEKAKHDMKFYHYTPLTEECDFNDWNGLNTVLPDAIKTILKLLEKPNITILIADETCFNITPTVYCVIMMLKYQIRMPDSLAKCNALRPRVNVTQTITRGLQAMQKTMDDKLLARLDSRLRHSNVMSLGF